MPYIKENERQKFDKVIDTLIKISMTKGELEYCVYKLMLIYMSDKDYKYSNLHDVVYATVHAAHEFERNYLDKRENAAKKLNGTITIPIKIAKYFK